MPENNRSARRVLRQRSPYAVPNFGRPRTSNERTPEPALPRRYRTTQGQQAVDHGAERRAAETQRQQRREQRERRAQRAADRGILKDVVDASGTILDNVLPNVGDEVAGFGGGVGYLLTGRDYMDGFERGQADFDRDQEEFEEDRPVLQGAARGVGMTGGFVLPAGRVLQAPTRSQKALQGAAWGAGYAGLSGAADGDGLEERATNAAIQAPIGAAIGYVAPGLVDDAIAAAPQVGRVLRELAGDERGQLGPDIPAARPLPGAPTKLGPDQELRDLAESYTSQAGIRYTPPTRVNPVDEGFHADVAKAFDEMEHNPLDPDTAEAYQALKDETLAQYNALVDEGYSFSFIDPANDPYASPWDAVRDLRDSRSMQVFPTDEGFGSGAGLSAEDVANNPLLETIEGVQWDGRPVTYNDAFRAVHDAFGHAKEGVGFRAAGENAAYQQHLPTFSPAAQRALASETLGQNSWLNYGPHGETNRTAQVADTVFADQKIGLLPDELIYAQTGDFMPSPRSTSYGMRENPAGRGAARTFDEEGLQARLAEINTPTRYPLQPEDFRQEDLSRVMERDDWALMTGENPMGKSLDPDANAALNAKLAADLDEMGIGHWPVQGHYGGNPESSFLTSPITQEQAIELGKRYNQDSVLTNRGFLYQDGTYTPSDGAQSFAQAPEDFYSVIDTPEGPANFAVNLKWGDDGEMVRLPDPTRPARALRSEAIVGTNGRPGEAYSNPSLISTRRPSKPNYGTQGDPDQELLIQTGQSLKDAPDALAKNMDLLRQEPFMQGAQGSPDELYDTAVRRGADNLKYIAEELMPQSLVDSSRGWYNTANGFAEDMASRYDISGDQASGVLAALSPQNHWANNVANAEQLLQLRQGGFDGSNLGPAAADLAEQMAGNSSRKKNAIALMGPDEARRIMETPFEELPRVDQRHKIAMLAELELDPTLYDIAPDGTRLGAMGRVSFGSSNEIGAALDILNGKPVGRVLSGGGKVPSFYNNIVDPDAPLPMVTTDTHHAGAFSLFPGGGNDAIVQMGMGRGTGSNSARTGSKGIYGLITDATTLAGQELDMLPREVQSVVWEGVRNLWGGPGVKTNALKQEVSDIWATSATPEEARRRIGVLMGAQ